jgi:hypothetical protein
MRILIDECIDERFRNSLTGHDSQTARYAGFTGLKNGDLLKAAEAAEFDVFLTVDQGIEYQQNLSGRKIAIIIVRAKSNRLYTLLQLVPACLAHIESIQPGQVVSIEAAAPWNGKPIYEEGIWFFEVESGKKPIREQEKGSGHQFEPRGPGLLQRTSDGDWASLPKVDRALSTGLRETPQKDIAQMGGVMA